MTTPLDRPLKRELEIAGRLYTLTVDPERLRLVPKGRRKGQELEWRSLVSGDAALAVALNASLQAAPSAPEVSASGEPRRGRATRNRKRRQS